MTRRAGTYHVLFLCTGNSARSIMAEALLNSPSIGKGRFTAHSAGSHPKGAVHPMAIDVLTEMKASTRGLRSKSWGEFAGLDAPGMDFIFTVCDAAAGEVCPIWPGKPMTAHWGIPDPAAVEGTDEHKRRAFLVAATQLRTRLQLFASLPIEKLEGLALREKLIGIGKSTA
jgi:protein-tyrosine-phosphatase